MQQDFCGIYEIRCMVSGKSYVGSSVHINRRWSDHRYKLRRGDHPSPRLQHAWNTHGEARMVHHYSSTNDIQRAKREAYALAHKDEKRAYDRTRRERNNAVYCQRAVQWTTAQRAAHNADQRRRYALRQSVRVYSHPITGLARAGPRKRGTLWQVDSGKSSRRSQGMAQP